jgi:hypothetical protein
VSNCQISVRGAKLMSKMPCVSTLAWRARRMRSYVASVTIKGRPPAAALMREISLPGSQVLQSPLRRSTSARASPAADPESTPVTGQSTTVTRVPMPPPT